MEFQQVIQICLILKDNYDIPEELKTEKEIIDYCQELFYEINEQKHT